MAQAAPGLAKAPNASPVHDHVTRYIAAEDPLHALHLELGAKMVPFAGYDMPVQLSGGILAEHRHCRESAALFDVSHMGQCGCR